MFGLKILRLPEIVPQDELKAWRAAIKKEIAPDCPPEVINFINVVANNLPDFERVKNFTVMLPGHLWNLCGAKVDPWDVYPMEMPHMQAVDNVQSMHRAFNKRGKQGLIDWLKARCKETDLEKLLMVLTVEIFKEDRPEFKAILDQIKASKKIDSIG